MKPLWNHQVHGIRVADALQDLGLFYEQGTGKSRTTVEILRRRYAKESRLMRTLILAPVIVCENWKNEFKMYSKINPNDILVLTGTGKDRIKQMKYAMSTGRCNIVVTNYEAMQMDELYALFMQWEPEILVCDESQRLKSPESKRAKKVAALADITKHNFVLTGTPILDGKGLDIFMQFRVLDRGATFGKNFFAFRASFFMDKNANMPKDKHFPNWVPNPLTAQLFQQKISTKALRVLKKDCLDLPPFVRQVAHVTLSTEQAKAYREMKNEYVTWVESQKSEPKAVVAQLAITKALRLQQIVTGFVNTEDGTVVRFPCPRLDVLEELLTDIPADKKVIIWACFKENYKQIAEVCAKVGRTYRELHGEIPHKVREQNMRDFRGDPGVTVMIANQGAGGVGINLVEASFAIYYSKNFKLEDDLQSEARNYRGGSEVHESVTRIDLVTPHTLDELINSKLENKQQVGESILTWYKEE